MAIVGNSFGARAAVHLEQALFVCIPATITTVVLYGLCYYLWGA